MPGRWAQGKGFLSDLQPCLVAPHGSWGLQPSPGLSSWSPSPAGPSPLSPVVRGSWGARAAAQPLVGLPSYGKEGPCAPKAAQVAPARRQAALPRQQQQQIRFVCPAFAGPTKQVLILLNKYEVMAAGLGAKQPGDILGAGRALQQGRTSAGSRMGPGRAAGSRAGRVAPGMVPGWLLEQMWPLAVCCLQSNF